MSVSEKSLKPDHALPSRIQGIAIHFLFFSYNCVVGTFYARARELAIISSAVLTKISQNPGDISPFITQLHVVQLTPARQDRKVVWEVIDPS